MMSKVRDPRVIATLRKRKAREGGFTLAEIMVSMIVFVIALVGLVAMESRAVEAQRASMEIREAERIAQEVMSEMQATSFDGLVEQGFDGVADPVFPYSDLAMNSHQLRDYRGVPADASGDVPGTRNDFYWVGRTIERFPNDGDQPLGDPALVDALQLRVDVLWIDASNPQFPPPANVTPDDLEPNNIDPSSGDFLPWVRGITLTTVRINDGTTAAVAEEEP